MRSGPKPRLPQPAPAPQSRSMTVTHSSGAASLRKAARSFEMPPTTTSLSSDPDSTWMEDGSNAKIWLASSSSAAARACRHVEWGPRVGAYHC